MSDSKIEIEDRGDGTVWVRHSNRDGLTWSIPVKEVEALREYFQAERDRELGRERDAESQDWVVYPLSVTDSVRAVRVVNERYGRAFIHSEDLPLLGNVHGRVADRYFAAHPAHQPWHDAKPGEVWMLTMEGEERPAIVTEDGNFEAPLFLVTPQSVRITAGRRIWPVDEEGGGDD